MWYMKYKIYILELIRYHCPNQHFLEYIPQRKIAYVGCLEYHHKLQVPAFLDISNEAH